MRIFAISPPVLEDILLEEKLKVCLSMMIIVLIFEGQTDFNEVDIYRSKYRGYYLDFECRIKALSAAFGTSMCKKSL